MNREIILKQVHMEGDKHATCFDFRYVKQKRKMIFNKCLERCLRLNECGIDKLKFYIIEIKTMPGYLGAAKVNEDWPMEELSRKEISETEVRSYFI